MTTLSFRILLLTLTLTLAAMPLDRAAVAQEGGVLTGAKGEHAALFVRQAVMGDMFEITAAEIALQRTRSADVRAFAQMMKTDHEQSEDKISNAVSDNNLSTPLPTRLDLKHQQLVDQLKTATDADFDHRYIATQIDAHQEALRLYQHYGPTAEEPSLKAIAQEGTAVIQRHLAAAEALKKGT